MSVVALHLGIWTAVGCRKLRRKITSTNKSDSVTRRKISFAPFDKDSPDIFLSFFFLHADFIEFYATVLLKTC